MTKNCLYCGKSYCTYNKTQKYCSKDCYFELRQAAMVKVCSYCGKEYVGRASQKYCDLFCWAEYIGGDGSFTKDPKINTIKSRKMRGENNPAWKGGIVSGNRKLYLSREFKQWSYSVKERDNFRCQISGELGGRLVSHHILSFALYEEYRFDVDNGITLSVSCHRRLEAGLRREDLFYIKLNRFLGRRVLSRIRRLV